MRELFEQIDACNPKKVNQVLTVLEGANFGEKALFSDKELVWERSASGFFTKNKQEILSLKDSGIVNIAGQKVFCDTLGHEKKLIICGAGHVSMPVIQIGIMIGCQVTVIDDRPSFADRARRAGATRVICDPFEEALDKIEGNADTYFVIVTRGHRYDQICLRKAIEKEHAYIGMIGSRRRVAMVKQLLEEDGVDRAVLDTVYSPIGLDIGAESPEEIGVAIMAEIIEVKNKKNRTYGYSKEIMRAILDTQKCTERKVLATIVAKKGSAPQGIGVKMLVLSDGTCIGTIGGGCMEAEIVRQARWLMAEKNPQARICKANLTDDAAENDGMVCGGIVEVLLECIN